MSAGVLGALRAKDDDVEFGSVARGDHGLLARIGMGGLGLGGSGLGWWRLGCRNSAGGERKQAARCECGRAHRAGETGHEHLMRRVWV